MLTALLMQSCFPDLTMELSGFLWKPFFKEFFSFLRMFSPFLVRLMLHIVLGGLVVVRSMRAFCQMLGKVEVSTLCQLSYDSPLALVASIHCDIGEEFQLPIRPVFWSAHLLFHIRPLLMVIVEDPLASPQVSWHNLTIVSNA